MLAINLSNRQNGQVEVAFGMSRYEDDANVEAVFERADKLMYERKSKMKAMML